VAQQDFSVESEMQQQVVVFGCDRDYPPLSYLENGKPAGFDIELIYKTAEAGDFNPRIEPVEWSQILQKLSSEELDVASGIIRTKSRAEFLDFSIPYLSESYAVFTHRGSGMSSMADLKGRKLAVLDGDAIIETFVVPQGLDDHMILTPSFVAALQLVESGDADYTVAPYSMGLRAKVVLALDELKPSERSLLTVKYRFAVMKGRRELLFVLNEALLLLSDSGAIDFIYEEADFSRQFSISSTTKRTSIVHMIMIAVISLFFGVMSHFIIRGMMQKKASLLETEKKILESVIDVLPMKIFWRAGMEETLCCNSRCSASGGLSSDLSVLEAAVLNSGKSTVTYIRSDHGETDEWERITCLPLIDEDKKVSGVLGVCEDCSEERHLSAAIENLSAEIAIKDIEIELLQTTDQSTGFFNKTYLRKKLFQELEQASVFQQSFCIIMIDVRSSPNAVVESEISGEIDIRKDVASSIRKHIRQSDCACFIGAGVFIIILPKTSLSSAENISMKLMDQIRSEMKNNHIYTRAWELPTDEPDLLNAEISKLLDIKRDIK
jgi:diguanylate cyclase (GGDEF)-like protein